MGARPFSGRYTGRTRVDKGGAISLAVDPLEIDDQLGRVMLSICEYFRAKEGNDMIRDDLDRLVTEVCVVDSEVSIEPLDFVHNELPGDESLTCGEGKIQCHSLGVPVI